MIGWWTDAIWLSKRPRDQNGAVVGTGDGGSARCDGKGVGAEGGSIVAEAERQIERCWLVVVRVSVAGIAVRSSVCPCSRCRGESWSNALGDAQVNLEATWRRRWCGGVPIRELSCQRVLCPQSSPRTFVIRPGGGGRDLEDSRLEIREGQPPRELPSEAGVMMSGLRRCIGVGTHPPERPDHT